MNLREQLEEILIGRSYRLSRVCLMGIGNLEYGDDAFGLRLADALGPDFGHAVVVAETKPERFISKIAHTNFDHVIFLDAVDFGGRPGATILLNSQEIAARFAKLSTHKLSPILLARAVEGNGTTKAWLLGVQPQSLQQGAPLSPVVHYSLGVLRRLLTDVFREVPA
jgi:hydrogenase 3 maturation protease